VSLFRASLDMKACILLQVTTLFVGCETRRFHNDNKHRHKHTYLSFCANESYTHPFACVLGVDNVWPQPAVLASPVCTEASPPYAAVGTENTNCVETSTSYDVYTQRFVPTGLVHPTPANYLDGADTDQYHTWDRINCRADELLFATGWKRQYTPQECARLCSKIKNYHGASSCTHFSRNWIQTDIPQHNDNCGRDGDSGTSNTNTPAEFTGNNPGSAALGSGSYTYKGQCQFYNSANADCCATRKGWTDGGSCNSMYGSTPEDNWKKYHRTWAVTTDAYTPTTNWPIVRAAGRRLNELPNAQGDEPSHVHVLFFPNGTAFWAPEDEAGGLLPGMSLSQSFSTAQETERTDQDVGITSPITDLFSVLYRTVSSWKSKALEMF